MPDLKLGKLPDRTLVKISIKVMPDLAEALAAYAALYKETYGREEAVPDLVPAILSAFLAGDRVFAKARLGAAPARTPGLILSKSRSASSFFQRSRGAWDCASR